MNIQVEKDYTEAGEAKLKAELRTNETLQCRKRKQIPEQVMDHQTEYDKKMKPSEKKQRSFKVDDCVDKTAPLHPDTILGKIIDLEENGNCTKVVAKFEKRFHVCFHKPTKQVCKNKRSF